MTRYLVDRVDGVLGVLPLVEDTGEAADVLARWGGPLVNGKVSVRELGPEELLPTDKQGAAMGRVLLRAMFGREQPWRATATRLKNGAIVVSIFGSDDNEPPTRYEIDPRGAIAESQNLD